MPGIGTIAAKSFSLNLIPQSGVLPRAAAAIPEV